MRTYCSLADSKYLPQLLALYESLKRHSSEPFTLHVLALDDDTESALRTLPLPEVDVISIYTFAADMGIEGIRESRTHQEWCWTLASQLCEWLALIGLREITYIDADILFFGDPAPVFDEIGDRSIAITPHQFIPSKQHLDVNGIYNVGFVHFKNTQAGRDCLSRWAQQVRERCSAIVGCGDQLYLNSFPVEFNSECCVIRSKVNIGPWSLANWRVTEGPRLDGAPLVGYHFHEYLHDQRLTNYDLRPEDIEFIYRPYIAAVESAKQRIESVRQPV